jgi:anti-sigma28 factor (negative regulator of flagellin synthesis)
MTMKVENSRTNEAVGPVGVDLPRTAQKTGAAAGSDQVRFSGDLRLAHAAVKAAGTSVDVRPDVVAEARLELANGTLGNDLERLADRIVDALTYSHDDNPS